MNIFTRPNPNELVPSESHQSLTKDTHSSLAAWRLTKVQPSKLVFYVVSCYIAPRYIEGL